MTRLVFKAGALRVQMQVRTPDGMIEQFFVSAD